jgi:uncharacterized membrane protein YgaE (UPF0421/DUF939 family)
MSKATERITEQWDSYLAEHPWLARGAALGPRAARHSRRSTRQRVHRLRQRSFFIVQCAISAGVAWFIAGRLLGHELPFFAPIAALIALGQSYGQRLERVVEIVVGVAVGVLVGDLLVTNFGSGYWQLALVVLLAMGAATLLDAGVLMTTQAGVQAAVIVMLVGSPGTAFSRWVDAVVGGGVALAAATITPATPLRRPRQHTSAIVAELSAILADTATALRTRDGDLSAATLDRARRSEDMLLTLRELSGDGLAVVRASPFRRRHLPAVQAIADLLEPLDRAVRNVRVLVRRAGVALMTGEQVPPEYIALVADLSTVTAQMAASLRVREMPEPSRAPLYDVAERTRHAAASPSLSSEVIRAQVRSTVLDLLMVTGLDYPQARRHIPADFDLTADLPADLGVDLSPGLSLDLPTRVADVAPDQPSRGPVRADRQAAGSPPDGPAREPGRAPE